MWVNCHINREKVYDMSVKIVIVGSFNADLTAHMERMPRRGETVQGKKFIVGPGGKGSNQAVAAARLGADVTFIGRVGCDVFASFAYKIWEQEGINTTFVKQDSNHETGVAPIFVDDHGENSICVVLGANLAVCKNDIDAGRHVVTQADVLLTQLEIQQEAVCYALSLAKELGVKTILNPAPAQKTPNSCLEFADYITPTETELEILTNNSDVSFEEAARLLVTNHNQSVIVTLGSKGAMCVQESRVVTIPGFEVKVTDTTGAGDAFNAGFAVALAEGKTIIDAIRFANATAALCVTKPGTAPSMPYRVDVEKFLKYQTL